MRMTIDQDTIPARPGGFNRDRSAPAGDLDLDSQSRSASRRAVCCHMLNARDTCSEDSLTPARQ